MKAMYYSESNIFSHRQTQTTVRQKLLLSYTLDLNSSGCSFTVR